jgi:hypothetical protein
MTKEKKKSVKKAKIVKGKPANFTKNRGKGPKPGEGGRPKKEFDINLITELCEILCTQQEIESVMKLDRKTIESNLIKLTGLTFSQFYEQKSAAGKCSFRRHFWNQVKTGDWHDNNLVIFAAKNRLGMADKVEIGEMGENLALTQMTDEEREKQIKELASRIMADNQQKKGDSE